MRFTEIGQQLRAYRLESGMRAEEIAARLGVSRAALYRYEKGDVIKMETVERMAELLKTSPLTLLGVGVEYYNRPIAFFERLRQLEATCEQLLLLAGRLCYLTTSDAYDAVLAEAFEEGTSGAGPERENQRSAMEQTKELLATRKRQFGIRRPGIICMVSLARLKGLLQSGIAPDLVLSERTRRQCRLIAAAEVEAMAALMDTQPIGLQFGVLASPAPPGGFLLLRARDRATVAINPFRTDERPEWGGGVAMVTAADEALAAHQRAAEAQWREALKGATGAARLRELVEESRLE